MFHFGPGGHPEFDALLAEMKRLREAGEPFHHVKREIEMVRLRGWKRQGLGPDVWISTGGCCEACDRDDGRRLTLDEALAASPIPHADCTRYRHLQPEGACWCTYVTIPPRRQPRP